MGIQLGTVLLYIFTAIYLAGSGINSQTMYAATTGFHGSMLFTLSLPASRRRLLFARAGLGALLTLMLIVIMAGYILHLRPEATSALQAACVSDAGRRLHHAHLCSGGAVGLRAG